MGRAGAVTGPAATARRAGAAAPTSASEPHAWHSGQRPTHLAEAYPHSLQRWAGRADFTPEAGTTATLTAAADSSGDLQLPSPAPDDASRLSPSPCCSSWW